MSTSDPNRVIVTGENPFIRMSAKDGDPNSTDASFWRILFSPGGLYLGTFLSKRHARCGQGREVAPGTVVIDGLEERDHPHHYCDARGVVAFMAGFELWSLVDRCHEGPATYHWHLLAERLPGQAGISTSSG